MTSTQMFQFGSGLLTAVRTDASGVQTPRRFGTLQDVSIEFNGETKELFGQYQFPVDTARGKTKISGKAKVANIDAGMYNDLFFGQTLTTGASTAFAFNEARTVPAPAGPYTVTVTNNTGTVTDYGVFYASTGVQLDRGATATGAGVYSFASGVYTFHSADASTAVLLNYSYTPSSGQNILISGQKFMGNTPTFQLALYQTYQNQSLVMELYKCISSRLTYPTRTDDYVIADFDFSSFSNAAGSVGKISTSV